MNALEIVIDQPLAEAEAVLRQALSEQGFGILTEIDVAATLQAKLGVHRPPLKIFGACNPSIAHRALEIDPSLSLLLPCNVVIEDAEGSGTRVTIADPHALLTAGGSADDRLEQLASEISAALEGALTRVRR